MPSLASLIPTRFAQACATEGFVAACRESLTQLAGATNATSAALVLAGAAGGPAAFLAIYAGAAILQWKHDDKKVHEAKARMRRIEESILRIEELLTSGVEIAQLDRALDELLKSDEDAFTRFDVEVRDGADLTQTLLDVICGVFEDLGFRRSLDEIQTFLHDLGATVSEIQGRTRVIDRKQNVQLTNQDKILQLLEGIDQRQKSAGQQEPELTDEDKRILAEARAHGDAKAQAQAAIMQRDFAAADPLIEVVTQRAATELFDALTLKGDRHYYAGEFDAAVEPYEKALELRPEDITARNNAAKAHNESRLGSIYRHQRRAIEIYTNTLDLLEPGAREWAIIQTNLGNAYRKLATVCPVENGLAAINAHQQALTAVSRDCDENIWATINNNLGNAYSTLESGDIPSNQHTAIKHYQSALAVYEQNGLSVECAKTQLNLGNAFLKLGPDPDDENMSQAILAYVSSLSMFTRERYPEQWAALQNNFGQAYLSMTSGDCVENIKLSINSFLDARKFLTHETDPVGWARICSCLGRAHLALAEHCGQDRCGLLRKAIAYVKGALTVRTGEEFPRENNRIRQNLQIIREAYESAGCLPLFDEIDPAS